MGETVFAAAGDWAVGSDGIQWILYRRWKDGPWRGVSFVRSTRDILARCMREKGVEHDSARLLLAGLPDTFDQWKTLMSALESAPVPSEAADEPPDRPPAPLPEAADAR